MKTWFAVGVLVLTAVLNLAAAADSALTNEDIVKLTRAGLGPAVIVAKIELTETAFDTSVDALLALAEQGVEDGVIAAMMGTSGPPARDATATRPAAQPEPRTPVPTSAAAPEVPQPRAIPGSTFQERLRSGAEGPLMVVVPAGRFRMGCLSNDDDCYDDEKPVHEVTITRPFAVSVYEVTFEDYDRFTYPNKGDDEGWGRGRRPVINVSWNDAKEYAAWLSAQTGAEYRLLSEAEWEYAARAGSSAKYSWGKENRREPCELLWLRQPVGQSTYGAGGFVPGQWIRPVRHARQRLRMGRGSLARQLCGRAIGRQRLAARRSRRARSARRCLRRRSGGPPCRGPLQGLRWFPGLH